MKNGQKTKDGCGKWTETVTVIKEEIFFPALVVRSCQFRYVTGPVLKRELPSREGVTKANWPYFHASVKECFVFVLPTLHSGAGSLDCSACL